MGLITKKIIYSLCIIFLYLSGFAQKAFYNLSERNWDKEHLPDSLKLDFSVFLVSDAGSLKQQSPVYSNLLVQLAKAKSKDVLIFLSSSIPKKTSIENALAIEIELARNFKGRTLFIPGHKAGETHQQLLQQQENYINQQLNTVAYFPEYTCSGPTVINMGNLTLIVLNSQWWLNKDNNPACPPVAKREMVRKLKSIIAKNRNKHIVLAQHHPLYANSKHGGYFTVKDHLFPLTAIHQSLYLPLPIIGSIYPILRQQGIYRQDLSNKHYKSFVNAVKSAIANENNLVVASGHEKVLQLTKDGNINQLISGSGAEKTKFLREKSALFGIGAIGYAKLNYYSNGQCWADFFVTDKETGKDSLIYRKPLYALPVSRKGIAQENALGYVDSVQLIAVGKEYKASKSKRKAFGKHYRESWIRPVHIKHLDLTRQYGGLKPVALADSNLLLQNAKGQQYTFSLINKNPYDLLPQGFEATFPEDVLQDQTSTSHPFGAVVVDKLAERARLPHRESQLFYMPFSRLLSEYLADFGGKAGILEKSIDKNALISTEELYKTLETNPNTKVKQHELLKARLFDFIIGDYDRGEETLLWQAEKRDGLIWYSPIPKTRKSYFTKIDGFLPSILKNLAPEVQHFDYKIKDPTKLAISARNLDRNLLNELSKKDWLAISKELQQDLNEETVKEAVKQIPKESYQIDGKQITDKLIARIQNLQETALSYYYILTENVKITASEAAEIIQINKIKDSTYVNIKNRNNDARTYNRGFQNNETRQIQLYTLGGKDSITVDGNSESPIKIRVIGEKEEDVLVSHSENKRLYFYDDLTGSFSGKQGKRFLSDKNWITNFNRNDFNYNTAGFSPTANLYNAKDFVSIGLAHTIKKYGFRKTPYAFEQQVAALIAPKTGALEVKYQSAFYSLFARNLDLVLKGRYMGPAYDFNFFGFGNSTASIEDIDYYRVRSKALFFNTYLQHRITEKIKIGIGPGVEYVNILKQETPNFLNDFGINNANYNWFFKADAYLDLDFRDNITMPLKGWRWTSSASYNIQTANEKYKHLKLYSDISSYFTPTTKFPITLALRAGASSVIGDYNFYHASTIGNYKTLRGFRAQRFSGRSVIYGNAEIRIPVTKIRSYLIAGDCGVYGFYDIGKVNPQQKGSWHKGYGPGIWLNLFDNLLLSLGSGFSKEGMVLSFDTGFRF